MRARNIKPGFFHNEKLADLDPLCRILFEGLWCIADRRGRIKDRPRRIKAEVLPYDNADIDDMLWQLADAGFILRYTVDSERFIQVIRFSAHQNPHKNERESEITGPYDEHRTSTVLVRCKDGTSTVIASPLLIPDSTPDSTPDSSSTREARQSASPPDSLAAVSPNSPHHANAHLHYASAGPGARLYSTRNERVPETVAVIELWQAADRTQKLRAGEIKRAECFVLPREAVDNAAEVIAALQASDFARKWPFAVAFRPKNLQDLLNGAYSQAEDGSEAEAEERYAQLARQI